MALTRRQVLKSALAISISACLPGCRFNESQHADVALDSAAEPLLEQQLQALSQFQQPSSDALQAWWQAADRIVAATAAVVIPQRRWNLVSLGVRPTVEHAGRVLLEVHCLDWPAELGANGAYGKLVRVELLHKLRNEAHFDGLPALTAAIARDVAEARAYLAAHAASYVKVSRQTTRDRI